MAVNPSDASDIILSILPKLSFEILPIEEINQRICFSDIKARSSLPKFNNSAMDGYAILLEDAGKKVKVSSTIFAGDDNKEELISSFCIKIMTGARVPLNTTAVVPKEDVEILEAEYIQLPLTIKQMQHIRFIGEDIKENELLIKKGEVLNFSHVSLLASQGISHIKVNKKPKVIVFSSGEELKLHYEKAEDFQIYNSNTPTFISRCKELGCDVSFSGQAKDSVEAIKDSITKALDADLIISSGGMSVGDADFTKAALKALEVETLFDGIFIKPGKPTVFAKINNTYLLNLPGNPLAASLIFEVFGKLLINKLSGTNAIYHNYVETSLEEELLNKNAKESIIPGYFNGSSFCASKKRSPGMVATLSKCNALMLVDKSAKHLKKNTKIKILPISWNFFTNTKKDYLTYE